MASVLALVAACGTDDNRDSGGMRDMGDDMGDDMGNIGGDDMGMDTEGALGDTAGTTLLTEVTVEELPTGPLAWKGFMLEADTTHAHGRSFVFADGTSHAVVIDGQRHELTAGESISIPSGAEHSHEGGAWEVLLAQPGVAAPAGASPDPLFSSGALDGIPDPPVRLRFMLVELPAGSQTSIHTHPGPEYIYTTRGSYTYESAASGEVHTAEGGDHALGPDTPVQKRNTGNEPAAFLSWFIVEPDEPFAPRATFDMP